jgi:hypothetical protein
MRSVVSPWPPIGLFDCDDNQSCTTETAVDHSHAQHLHRESQQLQHSKVWLTYTEQPCQANLGARASLLETIS